MSERFLVRIATDPRIQRIVWRPMTMLFFGDSEMDVDVVYKSAILCDACNAQLYTGMEEEKECPTGYVLSDGEYPLRGHMRGLPQTILRRSTGLRHPGGG
jgi:hypothetical protein